MGFFDFLKKKEEEVNLNFDQLEKEVCDKISSSESTLEKEVASKLSEVKYSREKVEELLKKIESSELEEKDNKRFNKAAKTSKKQLANQLRKMVDKTHPKENSLEEIKNYSNESYSFLINEINSYKKNIVYTSAYLKEEMKELGEVLQQLINNYNEINNLFNASDTAFKKEIKSIREVIETNKNKIKIKENELEEINKNIQNTKKEIEKKKGKVQEIIEGSEMKKIKELEEKKSELLNKRQKLKLDLINLISNVDKPLQRFNGLIKSNRWVVTKERADIVDRYLQNPFAALRNDVGGKEFKEILKEVQKAIKENAIELKEKEREKKIDSLQELINFDFFENIFWKTNDIQKELNIVEKGLNVPVKKQLEEEKDNVRKLEKRIVEFDEGKKHIIEEKNRLENEIEEEKERAVEIGETVLDKKINLKQIPNKKI